MAEATKEAAQAPPPEQDEAPLVEQQSTPPPAEEGAPLWMATFGDMMSLLLVFFILLFSMSELKVDKFLIASQSLREAVGGTERDPIENPMGLMPDPVDPDLELANPGLTEGATAADGVGDGEMDGLGGALGFAVSETLAEEQIDDMVEQIMTFIEQYELEETLIVTRDLSGLRLQVQAGALFRPGIGTIEPGTEWIIEFIADLTNDIGIPVIVSGHADNRPISTPQFASNWELSAARAAGVARQLAVSGHDATRIVVESYGENKPVADNSTDEGRAQNRRVEFFYSRKAIADAIHEWRAQIVSRPSANRGEAASEEVGDDAGAGVDLEGVGAGDGGADSEEGS